MKRRLNAGYLVAAFLLLRPFDAAAQRVKSDQDTLIELEQKWDAAFHNRDPKFIEPDATPSQEGT